MFNSISRPLGYAVFGLALVALLPLSGVLTAQNFPPGRGGFIPFQPNGQLRPNYQIVFGNNNGNQQGGGQQGGGQQGGLSHHGARSGRAGRSLKTDSAQGG